VRLCYCVCIRHVAESRSWLFDTVCWNLSTAIKLGRPAAHRTRYVSTVDVRLISNLKQSKRLAWGNADVSLRATFTVILAFQRDRAVSGKCCAVGDDWKATRSVQTCKRCRLLSDEWRLWRAIFRFRFIPCSKRPDVLSMRRAAASDADGEKRQHVVTSSRVAPRLEQIKIPDVTSGRGGAWDKGQGRRRARNWNDENQVGGGGVQVLRGGYNCDSTAPRLIARNWQWHWIAVES